MKLSVVLATYNEEKNLEECLDSVKELAEEIVIVDGSSTDQTVKIAGKFGARTIVTDNPPIFHINKQKALENATSDWILQLDADERVSEKLKNEIKHVLTLNKDELHDYQAHLPSRKLFLRHQKIIEKRDGKIGTDGEINAFFIPRLNYFMGRYLRYGGVYPDGVIRLVRKSTAHFPCKSVHEQIEVKGKVGWLESPLYHKDSPTFKRYLQRNNRYTDLMASQFKKEKLGKDPFTYLNYVLIKPLYWFILTTFRHKAFLDGWQGILFSFFSALRFPRAYIRYISKRIDI